VIKKTPIWNWIIPSEGGIHDDSEWIATGGKWLVYGSLDEMKRLAAKLDNLIESGKIVSAKYWNASETSAMCIYSLDRDNTETRKILQGLGYTPTAWEYDYARSKNWTRPRFFLSAFYKLRILLKTFGVRGAIRFIVGALLPSSLGSN
jgi:hypothetical protein